ncbi:MAG: hypothetical protein JST55_08180 [Bacteroidetes bacterium]|nr:hypothetical protein [Bacteroidota bacterium]
MKSKYFLRIFNSLICLALLSLSFMAANCNDILNALGSDDVTGSWLLTDQSGSQYDICNNETVVFSSTTATLTCPSSTPVTRSYTTANGVLTYTDTGISYNYSVSSSTGSTLLTMTNSNLHRTLQYTKQAADNKSAGMQQKNDKQNFTNSSELK